MDIIKPKLHTFSVKLSDGTFKKVKANFYLHRPIDTIAQFFKGSQRDGTARHVFTAFNPISIELIK